MDKPLTSSPVLRRALRKRISDYGIGRVEVHTAVLEAVTNDAEEAAKLRALVARLTSVAANLARETTDPGTEALAAIHCGRHLIYD